MNQLSKEKSAYLQQHQSQPVDWWPFCSAAIAKAKTENKPIFLSIGYSSCHWCHVMAHESFDDPDTADILNQNFINIKVDREEFPDLDDLYQKGCQLFIKRGGWPLSAFLLPNLEPYFIGTYFPKNAKTGQTSFSDLALELARVFREDHSAASQNAKQAMAAMIQGFDSPPVDFKGHFPHPSSLLQAIDQFKDAENGGYLDAPKFPSFAFYEWAVEQILEGVVDQKHADHILMTIERMLMGGIYDHARGGVHRYSTDKKWLVPHFEKMLYDQAGLLKVLAKASLITPTPLIIDALIQTIDYLSSEMLSEEKHFFSAQDADSEDMEGLYFTFSKQEFMDVINSINEDWQTPLLSWFQISEEGNFDHQLNVISLDPTLKQEFANEEGWNKIRAVKKALLIERQKRVPPQTDSKGVASWNFMMVSALCDVIQYCKVEEVKNRATKLLHESIEGIFSRFLIKAQENDDRVSLRHTTTKTHSLPYLEDYVFFAEANFRLYEISGNDIFKKNAHDIIEFVLKEFVHDGQLMMRAKGATQLADYPNLAHTFFDASFRSPACSFVHLVRRAALVFNNSEWIETIEKLKENVRQEALKNPLGCGEAIRAVIYPNSIYRRIEVPKAWAEQVDFTGFKAHLPYRFTIDFKIYENLTALELYDRGPWQICSANECSSKGEGLRSFIESLTPKKHPPKKTEKV